MAKRNALGKGLSALLENAETDITSFEPRVLNSVANIPISQISANPFQPRSEFEQEALEELAESIRVHGVIQPITVRKAGTRASILAGMKDIPAYIRLANDQEMLEMALIENIQREELNSIDVSLSYKRLMEECGLRMEELGERVGKKRSTVNNYLRLLKLPDDIQLGLKVGKISMGHARALVGVEDAIIQLTIFDRIIAEGLSVRNAEALARGEKEVVIDDTAEGYSKNAQGVSSTKKKLTTDLDLDVLSEIRNDISEKLGTKVDIKAKSGEKGTLMIHFEGEEELKNILDRL
jgi:ParB family chromosome partitioning protein